MVSVHSSKNLKTTTQQRYSRIICKSVHVWILALPLFCQHGNLSTYKCYYDNKGIKQSRKFSKYIANLRSYLWSGNRLLRQEGKKRKMCLIKFEELNMKDISCHHISHSLWKIGDSEGLSKETRRDAEQTKSDNLFQPWRLAFGKKGKKFILWNKIKES